MRTREDVVAKAGRQVAKHLSHSQQPVVLHDIGPHQRQRLLARAAAEQRRFRVQRFKVTADCHRLGEVSAIVGLQHRHRAARIDGQEFRRQLLAAKQIDVHPGNPQALLRQEKADAARVWRPFEIKESHAHPPVLERKVTGHGSGPCRSLARQLRPLHPASFLDARAAVGKTAAGRQVQEIRHAARDHG